MAISHTLAKEWIKGGWDADEKIKNFIAKLEKEEKERTIDFDMSKLEKEGVDTGIKSINPVNGEEVPIYIANYILSDYGTGAIMAVPAHDARDYEFAKKYNLEIIEVIAKKIREYKEGTRRVVRAGVVIVKDGKVLCEKLGHTRFNGKYLLVGGSVKEEETVEEGLLREIKEELGTEAKSFSKIGTYDVNWINNSTNNAQNALHNIFSVDIDLEKINDYNHFDNVEMLWVPIDEFIKDCEENQKEDQAEAVKLFLENKINLFVDEGVLINSSDFSGMNSEEARIKITEKVGGKVVSKYKLKDWVFARQRYWGEPFPIVFDENRKSYAVADKELPVILPNVENYEPTDNGESPLANIKDWVEVYGFINSEGEFESCEEGDPKAKKFFRETNTMPQWAGSSWYYLRYIDPKNENIFADKELEKSWDPVDFYVGGAEHATRHLIYARFWHKFLFDKGFVSYDEPFNKLQTVGLIMAEDGKKMSKRYGNVVNPDDVVKEFGADAMRTYEMFMGPFEKSIAWNTNSIAGVSRFLERVYNLIEKVGLEEEINDSKEIERVINETIKKVGEDIEEFKFNTAIAQMMICLNSFEEETKKGNKISRNTFSNFIQILSPFAVHICEEIWQNVLGNDSSIHASAWPAFDEAKIVKEEIEMSLQISGKFRGTFLVKNNVEDEELKQIIKDLDLYKKYVLNEIEIKKIIIVKNRLINIVI